MDYISKAECERRGFVKGADGLYRRLNTLEKYAAKGWLNFGNPKLTKNDRLDAGAWFYRDYMKGRINTLKAVDWMKEQVDGGKQGLSPDVWDARVRFGKALRAINANYLPVVRQVVLFHRPLNIRKITSAQYNHDLELAKEILCCGLDNLVFHYGVKIRRPKIKSYGGYKLFDDMEEWINEMEKQNA